ncbi:MAG: endo-1,4-beta-xylanase [Chitinispirillaceae bacterium]|nr:endo-1,4-beta-xylanase [Chitinispirillaceae bacterium]
MRLIGFPLPSLFTIVISVIGRTEPLRYYAEKIGLNIGVAIKETYITGNNQTHNNLVRTEFNTIVCENAMKAQNIAPAQNSYNFSAADQVVNFALQNQMKVRGHTLVWYNQNPSWLSGGSRQSLLSNMKYHIEKVMGHYKGKFYHWDVVNEAFADEGGGYRSCPWYTIIGEDYIDSAFVYARRADPGCKLFLNDYNNSYINDKSTAIYNKVKKMLENGIPVHGVGFQCHERTSKMTPELFGRIKENFDRFAALGLEIAITEIDIRTESGSNAKVQAEVYATFLRVGMSMPKFTTFMIWGVRDQDSWTGAEQNALIFDNSFRPKPAYDSLLAVLKYPTSLLPVDRRAHYLTQLGDLVFNPANNTVRVNDPLLNRPAVLEMFDLRGARMAKVTLRANYPLPLSSMKTAPGTAVIKAPGTTMRRISVVGR